MGGGLMQLVSYGAQDIYLTGNPTITFFKTIYKRHTNFAIEPIEIPIIGQENFGSELSVNIPKLGDLVTKMYFKCNLKLNGENGNFSWTNRIGHHLINYIDLLIGGERIDRQYSGWLDIWYELCRNISHDRGYNKLIGNYDTMVNLSKNEKSTTIFLPLQFYFNRHNGLAIPLISLQYHKLNIEFKINELDKLIIKEKDVIIEAKISDFTLLCNFVFLDNEENSKFSKNSHEYLIEQTQFNGIEKVNTEIESYTLNFNYPCKSLYWYMKNGNFINNKLFLYYLSENYLANNSNDELLTKASIRYILSQMYSENGNIYITLDGSGNNITNSENNKTFYEGSSISTIDGLVEIQCNYDNLVFTDSNKGICKADDFNNWIVIKPLSIDKVSKPIDELFNLISRTNDIFNIGHQKYDIFVNQLSNYGKYIDHSFNPILTSQLRLNGHIRFSEQESNFFNYLQPYETHKSSPNDGINLYSFSLYPIEHQPSGTCNFSKIDNVTLDLKFDDEIIDIDNNELYVFTYNYNILRFMQGMAGLVFNN